MNATEENVNSDLPPLAVTIPLQLNTSPRFPAPSEFTCVTKETLYTVAGLPDLHTAAIAPEENANSANPQLVVAFASSSTEKGCTSSFLFDLSC